MNDNIVKYESLLNEMSFLKKECFYLNIDFVREFGDEINNIFELKLESIILKKKIAFCVKKQNRGEDIDFYEMEEEVYKKVENKRKELEEMIAYKKAVDSSKVKIISYNDKKEIRTIYYRIVHLIHPDLHPELQSNKKIKDLWQEAVDSYEQNNLKILKRVFDKVLLIVDTDNEIVLNNIDEKIYAIEQEIKEIKDSEPYTYKFILNDDEEKENQHKIYHETEQYYLNYNNNLRFELSKFDFVESRKCDA